LAQATPETGPEWAKTVAAESLTVFDPPAAQRTGCAPAGFTRINRELRRRTRINRIFPNPDSCLRFISALLAELDDEPDPQGRSQLQPVTRTS